MGRNEAKASFEESMDRLWLASILWVARKTQSFAVAPIACRTLNAISSSVRPPLMAIRPPKTK